MASVGFNRVFNDLEMTTNLFTTTFSFNCLSGEYETFRSETFADKSYKHFEEDEELTAASDVNPISDEKKLQQQTQSSQQKLIDYIDASTVESDFDFLSEQVETYFNKLRSKQSERIRFPYEEKLDVNSLGRISKFSRILLTFKKVKTKKLAESAAQTLSKEAKAVAAAATVDPEEIFKDLKSEWEELVKTEEEKNETLLQQRNSHPLLDFEAILDNVER